MRAALIRSASTSVRPPAVGCVSSLSCASSPRRAPTYAGAPPPAGACAMTARARGRRLGSGMSINGSTETDHCHLESGRVPTRPGHEATISPPSRTCTLKIEGVEDPPKRRLGIDVEK
ncbi:hypothetical protein EVAR_68320_1 [Eumeta japonica]|uniref:Uncharacterized protein n=1 Tax=Eumeta variegata TaxID=151549 RepID=A0A4C2AGL5_EUMVA|nr:hypothetical protein EVAR_68320_1 [Eumeta japonica]